MSSYANRAWTPEREATAHRLVLAAINLDDDQFAQIIDQTGCGDMAAVAALLAEQLVDRIILDKEVQPTLCAGCGTDLTPDTPPGSHDWQQYMVHNQVWADADLNTRDGWYCIDCLETRLGRPLSGADFPDLPINAPDRDDDTPRLAALKCDAAANRAPK